MEYSNCYLSELIKTSNQLIDRCNSNDYPIKRILDSKMAYALLNLKRNSATDNFRIFSEFFSFAFNEVNYTYSTNYLDLFVAFLFQKQKGIYLEIGYCADLNVSCTKYLEAYYDWNGYIFDLCERNISTSKLTRDIQTLNKSDLLPSKMVSDTSNEHHWKKIRIDLIYVHNNSYLSDFQQILNCCEGYPTIIIFNTDVANFPQFMSTRMHDVGYTGLIPEFFDGFTVFVQKSTADPYFDFKPYPQKTIIKHKKENFELLSIHIPKCAGTSMTDFLKASYQDGLHLAYDKPPGESNNWFYPPITLGNSSRCVHGHLRIVDYLAYEPKFLMTMLRDPIDRIVSYYIYFKTFEPDNAVIQSMYADSNQGIVDFAKLIGCDYRLYLMGVDLEKFDFVGIVENYTYSLKTMKNILNVEGIMEHEEDLHLNASPQPETKDNILQDELVVCQLRDILHDDIVIYDYFVNKFHSQTKKSTDSALEKIFITDQFVQK